MLAGCSQFQADKTSSQLMDIHLLCEGKDMRCELSGKRMGSSKESEEGKDVKMPALP